MKNAMQLKAIIKNIAKNKKYFCGTCSSELYVGTFFGKSFLIQIS